VRVADLDRDMSHVIPTGMGVDSRHLFDQMTARTLALAGAAPGRRILDLASGAGGDARALAARGARVVGVEPSSRMLGLARLVEEREPPGAARADFVQAWGDVLPFADAAFDAAICKGSLDHFDRPTVAIAEMARVVRDDGRVVLAIANYESGGCRLARGLDRLREGWLGATPRPGRRMYDVPSDHFTRYDLALAREHAEASLVLERVEGLSLAWGFPGWARLLARAPEPAAFAAVQALDAWARRWPAGADVLLLVGRPRRAARTSR
jgi:demethylmenaquinone methyltransferase/2-methoxy-6-polyprenyl-1,4-benzoquinol methylase